MNDDLFHLAVSHLQPFDGCDPEFAEGVRLVAEALTKNHSLTAKQQRVSIWALIREKLDPPFKRMLAGCTIEKARALLPSELSLMGRQSPERIVDSARRETARNANLDLPIQDLTTMISLRPSVPKRVPVEEINYNLSLWDQNIQFAIHALLEDPKFNSPSNDEGFRASLDTIRQLICCLAIFRPKSSIDPEGQYGGRLSDARTRPASRTYCDPSKRRASRPYKWRNRHRGGIEEWQ